MSEQSTGSSTAQPQPPSGPLALVVHPAGRATLARLTEFAPVAAQVISELVGGNLEGLAVAGGDWCAYINEDGGALGLPPNPVADAMARVLGYPFVFGDYLKGVAVFLGITPGKPDEHDVPDYVIELARQTGADITATRTPSVIP
jgi:hypothetical protein